jgi:hypothetical protein
VASSLPRTASQETVAVAVVAAVAAVVVALASLALGAVVEEEP